MSRGSGSGLSSLALGLSPVSSRLVERTGGRQNLVGAAETHLILVLAAGAWAAVLSEADAHVDQPVAGPAAAYRNHFGSELRVGAQKITLELARGHVLRLERILVAVGDADARERAPCQREVRRRLQARAGAVRLVLMDDEVTARHDIAHAGDDVLRHERAPGGTAALGIPFFELRPQPVHDEAVALAVAALALHLVAVAFARDAMRWAPR